jgi:hypothetical protein
VLKLSVVAVSMTLALTGCASIFNGSSQAVTIRSVPEGAAVAVFNRAGDKVHTGTSPLTLTLARGAGYFKPEVYKISFLKEGFAAKELTVTGTMSGWYIGNLLFGGLLGMLAVDPVTGAMYMFPDSITETLVEEPAKTSEGVRTLTVVSTDSLTPEQLKLARLVPSKD